jgi:hypothetical protein
LDLVYTSFQSQFCQEATHPAKNNWWYANIWSLQVDSWDIKSFNLAKIY